MLTNLQLLQRQLKEKKQFIVDAQKEISKLKAAIRAVRYCECDKCVAEMKQALTAQESLETA